MAQFDHAIHDAADVGAYVGVRFIPRCPACRSANTADLATCAACGAAQPPRQQARVIQGRLTDGTLKWFHLARWSLTAAAWLNKLADWLEGKNGR